MKTCIHLPSYLDGYDDQGDPRLARNIRFIQYYSHLKDTFLSFDKVYYFDNGSAQEHIEALKQVKGFPRIVFKYSHLPRGPGNDYPFCWRAVYEARRLIDLGYEKIIFLDSDCFILTKRLADYVNSLESGWTALWCKKHQFPENQLSVLCKDQFEAFAEYCKTPWHERLGRLMERDLPFTEINHHFLSDRYGEDDVPQNHQMDLYAQAKLKIELKFNSLI